MHYRSIPYAVTKIVKQFGVGKYVPGVQCTAHGKDFELILTLKMQNRHPYVGEPYSREFSLRSYDGMKSQDLEIL